MFDLGYLSSLPCMLFYSYGAATSNVLDLSSLVSALTRPLIFFSRLI
jgi:hypothetical protein